MIKATAFKKPFDMDIQTYFDRLEELNNYLAEFPPFKPDQNLSEDKMLNLAEEGVPRAWYEEIKRDYRYDPSTATLKDFMNRCQTIEEAEKEKQSKEPPKNNNKHKGDDNGNSNKAKKKNKKSAESKYCEHHGWCKHETSECNYLKKGNKQGNNDAKKSAYKPKKEELKAIIKEQLERTLKETVSGKKRKKDQAEHASDDASVDLTEFFDEIRSNQQNNELNEPQHPSNEEETQPPAGDKEE
jgi:hypothetical protein